MNQQTRNMLNYFEILTEFNVVLNAHQLFNFLMDPQKVFPAFLVTFSFVVTADVKILKLLIMNQQRIFAFIKF
jgi:hypothetical protein